MAFSYISCRSCSNKFINAKLNASHTVSHTLPHLGTAKIIVINKAAEAGLEISEYYMIGDSPWADIRSAKNMGWILYPKKS
jgi:ribonucleotide monophosphatase NagD (HAD superfamily)